jgi:hypothetical protein
MIIELDDEDDVDEDVDDEVTEMRKKLSITSKRKDNVSHIVFPRIESCKRSW